MSGYASEDSGGPVPILRVALPNTFDPAVFYSRSAAETVRFGERLGRLLRAGDVIALGGELGSGKTCLTRGIAAGIGVAPSAITSPTFTFVQGYRGRVPFYHIDLYRLTSDQEAGDLGLEEYLGKDNIAAIEWADKILSLLPQELLWIHLRYRKPRQRSIELRAVGERYSGLLEEFGNSNRVNRMPYSGSHADGLRRNTTSDDTRPGRVKKKE